MFQYEFLDLEERRDIATPVSTGIVKERKYEIDITLFVALFKDYWIFYSKYHVLFSTHAKWESTS